eukprot:6977347-Alexandrium_andersonii.AAC.1
MLSTRGVAGPGRAVGVADAGAVRSDRGGLASLAGGLAGALGVRVVPVIGIVALGRVVVRLTLGPAVSRLGRAGIAGAPGRVSAAAFRRDRAVGALAVPAPLGTGGRGALGTGFSSILPLALPVGLIGLLLGLDSLLAARLS